MAELTYSVQSPFANFVYSCYAASRVASLPCGVVNVPAKWPLDCLCEGDNHYAMWNGHNNLKKIGINILGPFSADTIFLKKNRKKFDIIVGMYHDQVLTPIKTILEYKAINITAGLPFIRISPDHGPNEKMIGKNLSNPDSLIEAVKFLDK